MAIWIILGVIVLIVLYIGVTYNALTKARNRVKTNWAQIDVVLKRRADLIPNLVETVKGYAKHEKETLDAVIKARNTYVNASLPEEQMAASGELSQALNKLMMLSEAYPDLKANTNFVSLQKDLKETENKIEMFPSVIIANMFGFKPFAFFEVETEDKKVPEVKF